jgi:hypothetical protein
VPGSLPVLFFGDPDRAITATVGINPISVLVQYAPIHASAASVDIEKDGNLRLGAI